MTYGDELRNRLETGWGALLARRLGADFINLGACAGSNRRLVRMTVEHLPGLVAQHNLRPDQVLFLGMWTALNRFEVFADEADGQRGLPESISDPGWCRIHPAYIARRDARSIIWYRHLQHDLGDRSEFLLNWILLDAWLAARGYHYGFLWAYGPDPSLFQGLEHFDPQLDRSRIIGSDRLPNGGPSIYSVGESLDDLGPREHPLERSQEVFVDSYVHEWVLRLLARPAMIVG